MHLQRRRLRAVERSPALRQDPPMPPRRSVCVCACVYIYIYIYTHIYIYAYNVYVYIYIYMHIYIYIYIYVGRERERENTRPVPVTSEIGTPTRAPDNRFRIMQDYLNSIRSTSLLNLWGWGRGFLFHR